MKILIAGGTGFIGRNLVDYFEKTRKQDELFIFHAKNTDLVSHGNTTYVQLDVLHEENVRNSIRQLQPECIINLVGVVDTSREISIARKILENDTVGLVNLLNGALESKKLNRVISMSSAEVYGNNPSPFIETQNPDPFSPYSISKFANEQLVEFFGVRYDVQCTSIRSSSAYGPFQNPSKLIPYIITNGLEGKSILLNSPDIAIDYIFVQDVARAISCAVDKDVPGGTVNIGSSEPITVHELVSAIECIMSKKLDVSYSKKTRLNENSRRFSSIDKAKKYLGWNPTTSIEDGLRQTVDWYEKNYAKE